MSLLLHISRSPTRTIYSLASKLYKMTSHRFVEMIMPNDDEESLLSIVSYQSDTTIPFDISDILQEEEIRQHALEELTNTQVELSIVYDELTRTREELNEARAQLSAMIARESELMSLFGIVKVVVYLMLSILGIV